MAKNKRFKPGDLVYLPANVRLLYINKEDNPPRIRRVLETEEPCHVVVADVNEAVEHCEVLYKGDTWSVDIGSCYTSKEE